MDIKLIEERAEALRKELGGRIFSFPVDENDPYSKYAVTMKTGENYKTYPTPLVFEEAAGGIASLLEGLEEIGEDADFERNVRFVSFEAQVNSPSLTMKKLRDGNAKRTHGFVEGDDIISTNEETKLIHARGLLKLNYILLVQDKNPVAIRFMDLYYKLLENKKYGKTAAAIKQEVRRKSKDDALKWIEATYKKFINDDMEVFDILQSAK